MTARGGSGHGPGDGIGDGIMRTLSRTFSRRTHEELVDDSSSEKTLSKADDWKLMPNVKGFREQNEKDNVKGRRLGVTWKDLTVKGVGADAAFNENAISQFNIVNQVKEGRQPAPLKTIVESSHGCVKPGEMLLVLGRPGAGCTTLLKVGTEAAIMPCT